MTMNVVITLWELLTKCQTITFIMNKKRWAAMTPQWIHKLLTVGVHKDIIINQKFQANHYTNILSFCLISRSNGKAQSWCWLTPKRYSSGDITHGLNADHSVSWEEEDIRKHFIPQEKSRKIVQWSKCWRAWMYVGQEYVKTGTLANSSSKFSIRRFWAFCLPIIAGISFFKWPMMWAWILACRARFTNSLIWTHHIAPSHHHRSKQPTTVTTPHNTAPNFKV